MGWQRNVRMLAAALKGRDASEIMAAMARNGRETIHALLQTPEMQPFIKEIIEKVLDVIQQHWSPRQAVFLMAEVHTSRSEFDTLRHLLSFIYNPETDRFEHIPVWVNPHDEGHSLDLPTLVSRVACRARRSAPRSTVRPTA